jgi:saccharopine dehydrogenase-like NADP-dependent oxidoreductase
VTRASPRVAVVGAGPMGVATARALLDPGRGRPLDVLLIDRDSDRLERSAKDLAHLPGRLESRAADLSDEATRAELAACDAVAAALTWADSQPLLDMGARYPIQLATIGRPPAEHLADLPDQPAVGARMVIGGGLEPGLTEILARHLIDQVGPSATLRLYCGGVPARPRPPLRHLSWYGSRLTISPRPTFRIRAGVVEPVARFSGVELVEVPGLGVLEAFHDGLAPWIAADPAFSVPASMDQKTLRWPGFAAGVRLIAELGLLSPEPVPTADGEVRPRVLLDELLRPHITPRPGDADITLLAVEATSARAEGDGTTTMSLLLRAGTDPATGATGMARLTGGALAATTRLLADGSITRTGILYPHQIFAGSAFTDLLAGLAGNGISVEEHAGPVIRPAAPAHDFLQQRDE